MEIIYVSFPEAQKLIPIFKYAARHAPYKEAKESAKRILPELELVRDLSYGSLHGRQVILSREDDREFLIDALRELEDR